MFKNLSTKRLIHYAGKVYDVESKAFASGDHDLFQKCYQFNDEIFRELRKRGYK